MSDKTPVYILLLFFIYSLSGFSQKIESYKLTKEQITQRELSGITDFPIYKAIEFQDKGQGLNDEDAEKLFKKFAKLSSKPTGRESSNGLGLSICKSLVELHNGQIFVESKLGEGSKFEIIFSPSIVRA